MNKLDRYTKLSLYILFLGHLIAVYTSFGYHHPDEQFQILEWANAFLGWGDSYLLPWEFGEQIRPLFQPMIHAVIMKAMYLLGIYNAFTAATFFRAIYVSANIVSIGALWVYFSKKYSLNSIWFLFISSLWFFPYIHVRTSSENLAGIFVSFALITLAKAIEQKKINSYLIAGLLFGFAFIARFQIALGLVGVAVVLLIRDKTLRKSHFVLLLGFIIPVIFGAYIDHHGYRNWVFTPYQYFKVNILENKAAFYNPYPFYQYFIWIAQLNPFISIPLFYGAVRYWIQFNRDVFMGFTFTFFIVHCFIRNKEYRFLFPILNIVPFMAAAYFSQAKNDAFVQGFKKLWFKAFVVFFIIVSAAAFAASTLRGAANLKLWLPHAVYRHHSHMPKLWLSNEDYLESTRGLFYDLKRIKGLENHEVKIYKNIVELSQNIKTGPVSVLIDGSLKNPLVYQYKKIVELHSCEKITSAYPDWLSEKFNVRFQALYRCGQSP